MDMPPPLTPEPGDSSTPDSLLTETDRSWCIALHLSGLSGIIFGWALAHIIAPLVIWLIKRADSPAIDSTGKEVLNFQISYSIYMAVAGLLCFVFIGFLIFPILFVTWLTLIIIAAVKTSNGENYRYPAIIRFFR
jgi:uncharacterized protein